MPPRSFRLPRPGQGLFYPGLDLFEKIGLQQVGAGLVMGKFPALAGAGGMHRAPPGHPVVAEEGAGAIASRFEGVPAFDVTLAHFTVADFKMPGKSVDILRCDQERRALEPVTAIAWAVVAVNSTSRRLEGGRCRCHCLRTGSEVGSSGEGVVVAGRRCRFFTLCSDGSVVQLTECTMQRRSWSVKGKAEIGLPEGSASARLYNCPLGMADKRRD